MYLTVPEFKGLVPTADLSDAALQVILDASGADIEKRCGPLNTASESLNGGGRYIFPSRPVDSITSIKERRYLDSELVTLTAQDYRLEHQGTRLYREFGLHSALGYDEDDYSVWGAVVEIVYVPIGVAAETARRKLAQRDLSRLSIQYDAASSVKDGTLTLNHVDYTQERAKILRRLAAGSRRMYA